MNEILGRMSTNGPANIEMNGDAIVERFNQAQTTSRLKSSESFRQIKNERDQAVNEVGFLRNFNHQ